MFQQENRPKEISECVESVEGEVRERRKRKSGDSIHEVGEQSNRMISGEEILEMDLEVFISSGRASAARHFSHLNYRLSPDTVSNSPLATALWARLKTASSAGLDTLNTLNTTEHSTTYRPPQSLSHYTQKDIVHNLISLRFPPLSL
jgi:hypothetical protein